MKEGLFYIVIYKSVRFCWNLTHTYVVYTNLTQTHSVINNLIYLHAFQHSQQQMYSSPSADNVRNQWSLACANI